MDPRNLAEVELFAGLPLKELEILAEQMVSLEISPGTILFNEGDRGDHFFVLADGEIEVIKSFGTPNERLIAVRKQGDFIGEMSLLNPAGIRMATVQSEHGARLWRLARDDFEKVLESNPDIAFQMVRELSRRLNSAHETTIADLQDKNRQLIKAYEDLQAAQTQIVEKERLDKELELAHEIQQSILPAELPTRDRISFEGLLQPARAVGGDFFDIYHLSDHKIAVMIGDVADKGVPSALVMSQTHALIFSESFRDSDPDEVLKKVNSHVLRINRSGLFITAIFGIVDTASGEFNFVRAGHEVPLFKAGKDAPRLLPRQVGQPLGIFDEPVFDRQCVKLSPDSSLLLYTDGVVDLRDEGEEQYGILRLSRRFESWMGVSDALVCKHLWEDLVRFQGGQTQYDDVTLVAIHMV